MLFAIIGTPLGRHKATAAAASNSIAVTDPTDAAYISGPKDKQIRLSALSLLIASSPAVDQTWGKKDGQRKPPVDPAAMVDGRDKGVKNTAKVRRMVRDISVSRPSIVVVARAGLYRGGVYEATQALCSD